MDSNTIELGLINENPTNKLSKSELFLGSSSFRILTFWNSLLYIISYFGIIITYFVYVKDPKEQDFFDINNQENLLSLVSNSIGLFMIMFLGCVRENTKMCLGIKYTYYLALPPFTIIQLPIIYDNIMNFTDIFEIIVKKINEGTENFFVHQHFIWILVVLGILTFCLLLFTGELVSLCIPIIGIFLYIFAFAIGFLFMLLFPFSFFFYQVVCMFIFLPALLFYDLHYILTNFKYTITN